METAVVNEETCSGESLSPFPLDLLNSKGMSTNLKKVLEPIIDIAYVPKKVVCDMVLAVLPSIFSYL